MRWLNMPTRPTIPLSSITIVTSTARPYSSPSATLRKVWPLWRKPNAPAICHSVRIVVSTIWQERLTTCLLLPRSTPICWQRSILTEHTRLPMNGPSKAKFAIHGSAVPLWVDVMARPSNSMLRIFAERATHGLV